MATGRRVLDDAGQQSEKEFHFHLLPPPPRPPPPPLYTNQLQRRVQVQNSMNPSYLPMKLLPSGTTARASQSHIYHPSPSNPYLPSFLYHGTRLQPYPEFDVGDKRYRECMDYAHLGCRHFVPCTRKPGIPDLRSGKKPRKLEEGATTKEEQVQEEISNSHHELTSSSGESGSVKDGRRELDPLELLAQVTAMADDEMKEDVKEDGNNGRCLERSGTFMHGSVRFVRRKRSHVKRKEVSGDGRAGREGAIVQSRRGRSQTLPSRFDNSVIGSWRKGTRKKM